MNTKAIMIILATLVILSFVSVGIAIGFRNYWLAITLLLLGFSFMGYGLRLKRKIS